MGKLKILLESKRLNITKFLVLRNKLCRTDHMICEKVGDNTMYYVYCKYIPMEIGHLFTFNIDLFTRKKSKRKATTYLKNINLKKRLWK